MGGRVGGGDLSLFCCTLGDGACWFGCLLFCTLGGPLWDGVGTFIARFKIVAVCSIADDRFSSWRSGNVEFGGFWRICRIAFAASTSCCCGVYSGIGISCLRIFCANYILGCTKVLLEIGDKYCVYLILYGYAMAYYVGLVIGGLTPSPDLMF